nr:MAG TPA: hypothetical protein [Caudoviricetes sp.]
MAEFEMKPSIRPCLVGGKKHIFHQWENLAWVVNASPLRGGHPGGQRSLTMAIVEDENGQVHEVHPAEVEFIDGKVEEVFEGWKE